MKMKKSITLLVAALLLFTAAVGTTIAYLSATPKTVENKFNPVSMYVHVEENFDNTEKKDVKVTNKSAIPVFVRVRVATTWVDTDGNVVNPATLPSGYTCTVTPENAESGNDWVLENGIWYYTKPVAPNAKTDALPQTWKSTYPENDQKYVWNVTILSEAIQPQPSDPESYTAAWAVTTK